MPRILRTALILCCLAALPALTSSASAAITIGTAPGGPMTGGVSGCFVAVSNTPVTCSLITSFIAAADRAPGGTSAPSAGVITSWYMAIGDSGGATVTVAPQIYSVGTTGTPRFTALRSGTVRPVPVAAADSPFRAATDRRG